MNSAPASELRCRLTPPMIRLAFTINSKRDTAFQFLRARTSVQHFLYFAMVVAILASRPGDVILLEAPEAHLHPRGQSKLGQLLARAASGGVQVIVETDSDHVMNGVRVAVHEGLISPDTAAFLYFRSDPKAEDGTPTVRTVLMDKYGRVEDWPEGFFDEMDRSLETLLTPKRDLP